MNPPDISVIVISYNMERELPRTLQSLSTRNQRGIGGDRYEIIVVDNGSKDTPSIPAEYPNMRLVRMENPTKSPVAAVNEGLRLAQGRIVGVMIDGARMASPGLLSWVERAAVLHPRPIIATMGYHLGPSVQSESVKHGYKQSVEDELLKNSGWTDDGYRLFDICTFAGSSSMGYFHPMPESNAIFMTRGMWDALGGFEPRFTSPGGGLVNLDTYVRACQLDDSMPVLILGEGTFHQIHGGIASNSRADPWEAFHEEYIAIRGKPFERPAVEPCYVGKVRRHDIKFIQQSAQIALHGKQVGTLDRLSKNMKYYLNKLTPN